MKSCTNNFGGTKLSGEVSLGVRAEKRLNTTALDRSAIETGSPNIIGVIKSRMRWAGHEARMGEMRNAYGILVGKPEGKRPLGRPNVDGRIIKKGY
jgi:hypothetical protein